jgi:hypothetical protein
LCHPLRLLAECHQCCCAADARFAFDAVNVAAVIGFGVGVAVVNEAGGAAMDGV